MTGWGPPNSGAIPRDFILEMAKGNVSGHSPVFPFGVKPNITPTESTLWDVDGDFTWPTGDEAWEIVSDNVNDALGGTGANVAFIHGLDSNFITQTEILSLNGTTPVPTVRIDWNRIQEVLIVFSGSGERNEGTITLRVASGGLTRSVCRPGLSSSFNGFFTVPGDKYRFIVNSPFFLPKGEDITTTFLIRADGTDTWLTIAPAPFYQSAFTFLQQLYGALPPKTDIELRVSSTNTGITATVGMELLEIDASMVNL